MPAAQLETGLEVISDSTRDIARLVVQAAEFSSPLPRTDRRKHARRPYPCVISVTPLADGTREPASQTFSVIGRNLSNLGLDFFHDYLISEKQVVIGLQSAKESWSHFVMELGWSRFVQGGWYISGGKFTQVIKWAGPGEEIMEISKRVSSQRDSF